MLIPTEPIGRIPRPPDLIAALSSGSGGDPGLDRLYAAAVRDTVERFEVTGCTCSGGDRDSTHSTDVEQLATTDDGGFAPFSDDTSTSRDTAFAKIQARVHGTALAAQILGRR
jgi:hypothetical protein